MKQLFVIYGKRETGKTELLNSLTGKYEVGLVDKEKGVYVIDLFCEHSAKEDVNKIIDLFNIGIKDVKKFEETVFYKVRKIILVGFRNLTYDETMRIRKEVNDNIMISSFEAKKFIEGEWK